MKTTPPDEALVEALAYQASQPTRSELEQDPLAYFVDFEHYRPLRSSQWQLVLGRRGTGKTLLLRKLEADLSRTVGTLCVYLDLQQLVADEDLDSAPEAVRANAQFGSFLRALTDRLVQEVEASAVRISEASRERALITVLQVMDSTSVMGARNRHVASGLRRLLTDLFASLELTHVVLLLDEWSALDPTASTQVQPLFADLLRRHFWGIPNLCIKIAGAPTQMRTSVVRPNGSVLGLESEDDLVAAVDLDVIYRRQSSVRMFRSLLNQRLAENVARSSGAARPVPRDDYDFVDSLFADGRAFQELALSAEYLPRRFLSALDDMQSRWWDSEPRAAWNVTFVRNIVRRRAERHVSDLSRDSSMLAFLNDELRPQLLRRGDRVFVIDSVLQAELVPMLTVLEGQRFIHPTALTVEGDSEGRYQIFQVDYGLWLSWRGKPASGYAAEWFKGENIVDAARLPELTLEVIALPAHDMICPTCFAVFATDSKSFQIRGLCPNCFEPVQTARAS